MFGDRGRGEGATGRGGAWKWLRFAQSPRRPVTQSPSLLRLGGRRRACACGACVRRRDGAKHAEAVRVIEHAPGQEVLDLGLVASSGLHRRVKDLFALSQDPVLNLFSHTRIFQIAIPSFGLLARDLEDVPAPAQILDRLGDVARLHSVEFVADRGGQSHLLRQRAGEFRPGEEADVAGLISALVFGELARDGGEIGAFVEPRLDVAGALFGLLLTLGVEFGAVVRRVNDDVRKRHAGLERKPFRVGVVYVGDLAILHFERRLRLLIKLIDRELLLDGVAELLSGLIGPLQLFRERLLGKPLLDLGALNESLDLVFAGYDVFFLRLLVKRFLRNQTVQRLYLSRGLLDRGELAFLPAQLLGDHAVHVFDQDLHAVDGGGGLITSAGPGGAVPLAA